MNGEQRSHDAQKTLADLRDHLARHDKPIAFFFGAGTSCSVIVSAAGGGKTQPLIPAVPGLTAACKKDGGDLGERLGLRSRLIAQGPSRNLTSRTSFHA
jgi:hypothetical protein